MATVPCNAESGHILHVKKARWKFVKFRPVNLGAMDQNTRPKGKNFPMSRCCVVRANRYI
jgi:hypothetical protein